MALKAGDRVECWSKDEGFLDSYFEADLQSISGKRCFVKYVELLTDDGDKLIENIPMDQLRPLPPKINSPGEDSNFPPGHSIEAYHKDGWWKGAVHKKVDKEYYLCYFLSNGLEQLRFHFSELRTTQEWINGRWIVEASEAWQPKPLAPPRNIVHLKLPSPRTPESPSPAHQAQGKGAPPADNLPPDDFVLDDDDEDVDIENPWDEPASRNGTECAAMPQLPSDEEGTVSDPGQSPSTAGVERLRGGNRLCEPSGDGKGGLATSDRIVAHAVEDAPQQKRKAANEGEEGGPGNKKRRKGPSAVKKRKTGASEKEKQEKSLSSTKKNRVEAGTNGGEAEQLAVVVFDGEKRKEGKEDSGALGFGPSPFGKNTVLRWGHKQVPMRDILRRSDAKLGGAGMSPYELECEIDRERRESCRRAETCRLRSQPEDGEEQRFCEREPSRAPVEELYEAEEADTCHWNEWGYENEERPCFEIEPVAELYDDQQHFPAAEKEAPPDEFSFKAAYGGILEALLRKDMLDYRRDFLLAELRLELGISDRCHSKQYQRALGRMGYDS